MPNGNTFCGETRNTLKKINVTRKIASDKVKVPTRKGMCTQYC